MVAHLRQAEAAGLFAGSGSPEAATEPEVVNPDAPGMNEADATWGGLFQPTGTETKQQKRARMAQVLHDREDGVRRCFDCNWEIDAHGVCDGCGREWDLSEDALSEDEAHGFLLNFGNHHAVGHHSDRSEDEDDESNSEDDGFIDDAPMNAHIISDSDGSASPAPSRRRRNRHRSPSPPAPRSRLRGRQEIVLSSDSEGPDEAGSGSGSGSDEDVIISRRGRLAPRVSSSDEEEEPAHGGRRRHVEATGSDEEGESASDSDAGHGSGFEDGSGEGDSPPPEPAWRHGGRSRFADEDNEDSEEDE
ncbi:hypothetical protein P7C70_g6559, partial [Phenoliferia sp. Uapishka_3]